MSQDIKGKPKHKLFMTPPVLKQHPITSFGDGLNPDLCYTYEQQVAIKHDDTKLRIDLVPVSAITALAAVLTFGAKKYSDRNWEKGFKWTRVYGALLRHLLLWYAGQNKDEESGLSHLDHILCNAAFLKEFETTHPELDDRVKK